MRKNLLSRFAATAFVGLATLPLVAHAEDKMMSKDKIMMDKLGMTMQQKMMMEKDMIGMTALQNIHVSGQSRYQSLQQQTNKALHPTDYSFARRSSSLRFRRRVRLVFCLCTRLQ